MTTIADIYLEAVNPERNCRRAYRITLSQDLFGAFLVETRHGRIGSYGRNLLRSFTDRSKACAFVEATLRRRQQAKRRLHTEYVILQAFGAGDLSVAAPSHA